MEAPPLPQPLVGPPPGWYPDPWDGTKVRFWDGQAWTPDVAWPPNPRRWLARPERATATGVVLGLGIAGFLAIMTLMGAMSAEPTSPARDIQIITIGGLVASVAAGTLIGALVAHAMRGGGTGAVPGAAPVATTTGARPAGRPIGRARPTGPARPI